MKQAVYIGPIKHLKGQTALLRDKEPVDLERILAQFDNLVATRSGAPPPTVQVLDYEPHSRFPTLQTEQAQEPNADCLAFGWHEFPRNDFETPQ